MTNFLLFSLKTGVFILLTASFSFAQSINDYLQAEFEFENGSLADSSPNAINGIGYNLSTTTDIKGIANGAIQFNGISSYIDCGTDNRNITDQLTISVWFKTSSSDRQIIVSKYDANDDRGYFLGIYNGEASLEGRDGSGNFYRLTSKGIPITLGQWHHLVGVIDKNEWRLYYDCQLVDVLTTSTATPQFATSDPLTIGRLSVPIGTGEYRYLSGIVDQVKLFNYPLPGSELQELTEGICPLPGITLSDGLVAYYPLDGNALDYSGNELHGAINGPVPTTNQFGFQNGAFQFDGVDDYITVEHDELLNFERNPFAISFWVQAADPDGPPQMVLQKGISGVDPQYWVRVSGYDEEVQLRGVLGDGIPASTILESTTPHFNDLAWHHVVFQRTVSTVELWVDGEIAVNLNDSRYRNVNNLAQMIIGAQNPWPDGGNYPYVHNHFNGNLDEIRLYNRFLNEDEINTLANNYCSDDLVIDEIEPQLDKYQTAGELSTLGEVNITKNTVFQAGSAIRLTPGFQTSSGVNFIAKIEDCIPTTSTTTLLAENDVQLDEASILQPAASSIDLTVVPNPFRSELRITITMDTAERASLLLLDMNGSRQELAFANRLLETGEYTYFLQTSNLPPGMYLLTLRTPSRQLTKKIIKIR